MVIVSLRFVRNTARIPVMAVYSLTLTI